MRILHSDAIIEAVANMCAHANRHLPKDVRDCLEKRAAAETSPAAREIFRQLKENYQLAEQTGHLLNRRIIHWDEVRTPLTGTSVSPFEHLMQRIEEQQVKAMIEESRPQTEPAAAPGH